MRAVDCRRRVLIIAAALAVACNQAAGQATVSAASGAASYWRQRVFFIPFQPGARNQSADLEKVELLMADGGQWRVLQTARPDVRGFSFHAPADGAYEFAVRLVDRRGTSFPSQITAAQLRVVVDTERPQLNLTASTDPAGRLIVRYEARDGQLSADSLKLELQADGVTWRPLTLGVPDVRQPDRIMGQWIGDVTAPGRPVLVRGTVEDRAGNRATAAAKARSMNEAPEESFDDSLVRGAGPDARPTPTDSYDSPVTGPTLPGADDSPGASGPLLGDPFAGRSLSGPPASTDYAEMTTAAAKTPAQFAAGTTDAGISAPPLLNGYTSGSPSIAAAGSLPFNAQTSRLEGFRATESGDDDTWSAPGGMEPADDGGRWVNSLSFDVDYDLQSVGPWGVARVELWATRDSGRTWNKYGVDPDNRGPMRVTAPSAGVYGFRIVVDGANGTEAPRPTAGDQPDLVVTVDMEAPRAGLLGAKPGAGALANHLFIRWKAEDQNLEPRPVSLYFSELPDGQWTTIATDLANTGEYAWQLSPTTPRKIYLRLDVRDRAGNVAASRTPQAVSLEMPQPRGRIRNIRPAPTAAPGTPEKSGRDRTARSAPLL
jgi:hypothetical protein